MNVNTAEQSPQAAGESDIFTEMTRTHAPSEKMIGEPRQSNVYPPSLAHFGLIIFLILYLSAR